MYPTSHLRAANTRSSCVTSRMRSHVSACLLSKARTRLVYRAIQRRLHHWLHGHAAWVVSMQCFRSSHARSVRKPNSRVCVCTSSVVHSSHYHHRHRRVCITTHYYIHGHFIAAGTTNILRHTCIHTRSRTWRFSFLFSLSFSMAHRW
jgi:hypothetical protein